MLDEIFQEALRRFLAEERRIIAEGVNERTLCGRLAMLLDASMRLRQLDGYYADTDYNRKQGGRVKTIIDGDQRVITIMADLIIHSRGEIPARDNLLAIEMKKSTRRETEKRGDRERLIAMTKAVYDDVWSYDGVTHPEHVCGYELGFFIELNVREMRVRIETFRNGALVAATERDF